MALTFNSTNQVSVAGLDLAPTKIMSAPPRRAGLSISPEQTMSRRANLLASLTFLALGLGFLAVTSLFIAALISLALS